MVLRFNFYAFALNVVWPFTFSQEKEKTPSSDIVYVIVNTIMSVSFSHAPVCLSVWLSVNVVFIYFVLFCALPINLSSVIMSLCSVYTLCCRRRGERYCFHHILLLNKVVEHALTLFGCAFISGWSMCVFSPLSSTWLLVRGVMFVVCAGCVSMMSSVGFTCCCSSFSWRTISLPSPTILPQWKTLPYNSPVRTGWFLSSHSWASLVCVFFQKLLLLFVIF